MMNTDTEISLKYVRPEITVVMLDAEEMMDNGPGVVTSPGDTSTIYAKPGDDEWEDEDESFTNKWDNLVPDNLPGTWQPVGE